MFKWLKSLFGVRPAEPTNYIEGVLEKEPVNVQETIQKIQAAKKPAKPTFDELMTMTKKEMIQYAEDHGIEVKSHWTKKNIAAEICR